MKLSRFKLNLYNCINVFIDSITREINEEEQDLFVMPQECQDEKNED